jgi:hypothetical protein
MNVRLHYPEVFDGSSVTDLIILMIGLKASVISNKRLDWTFRMAGYADKRHIAEWPTQAK